MPVTYSRKRYVFVCAGCGLLADSVRRDQMTCSTACRVRAHRNGTLQRWKDIAASQGIPPAMIGQAQAIGRLRPDLEQQCKEGTLTIDEAQPDMLQAFNKLLADILDAHGNGRDCTPPV